MTAAVGSAKSSPAAFLPTSNSAGSGKSEYVLLNSKPVPGSPFTATAYVSRETGLRVVHIDTPAPMVDLRVVVNTEIFDDSGAPHSLGTSFCHSLGHGLNNGSRASPLLRQRPISVQGLPRHRRNAQPGRDQCLDV